MRARIFAEENRKWLTLAAVAFGLFMIMLDNTVVAVLSEMTRTPLRNASGGKDHWGHTSALLLGAVRGNAVSGGTDGLLESMPMDLATGQLDPKGALCKYDNLCAGLLELVGVDPEEWLPGVVPFRGARV